jgi:hypothetical protein
MTLCAATLDAGANRHKIAIGSALDARARPTKSPEEKKRCRRSEAV